MPRFAPYGWTRNQLNIYVPIPAGAGAVELVTDFTPGFQGVIEKVEAFVAIVGAGAGATRLFRIIKGASTVMASKTIALADTDTIGERNAFTVVAADAGFGDTDTLTVDTPATGAVAYTAGALNLIIQYRQRLQRQAD